MGNQRAGGDVGTERDDNLWWLIKTPAAEHNNNETGINQGKFYCRRRLFEFSHERLRR